MVGSLVLITLKEGEFDIDSLRLERSRDYPRQVRITARVRYGKAVIRKKDEMSNWTNDLETRDELGVYVLKFMS